MKKIIHISLFFILILGFTGCTKDHPVKREIVPITLDNSQKSLVVANNAFGFDIFRRINNNLGSDTNIFISPLSISLALAMTYNGANGDTRTQMQNSLRFPALTPDEINQYFQKLTSTLLNLDPEINLSIASSIWYRKDFSVLPDFINLNRNYYNAEVQKLDFNDAASVQTINQWVADNTNNKISKVIDVINPDEVMFLINAIYFKGVWTNKFETSSTSDGSFNQPSGIRSTIPFMHQYGKFAYYSNDSIQMLEMPYGQGNFSMIVLLPAAGYSVSSLLNSLTPEIWDNWTDELAKSTVHISFPKFTFEFARKLNDDLKALGMSKAFTPFADFSNINTGGGLYINYVKHNSYIEVNEEGTEAAAATTVSMVSGGSLPIEFTADHPFIFAIRETSTNTLLFIGKVVKP